MAKYFQQPSVMKAQHSFSRVPSIEIPRSRFDRSHAVKTTFDAGDLVPFFVDEILPGDTFSMSATCFSRLATPLKPVMDNIYQDVHFWFVPSRLVCSFWAQFMGERVNPDDDPNDFSIPMVNLVLQNQQPNSLAQYFGLPRSPGVVGFEVSALPFRAYALIYNEWYRDQNLQDSVVVGTAETITADNTFANGLCLKRNKRHDYFTSCLPWPQKGDPVTIGLADSAPVLGRAPISGIGAYTGYTAVGGVDIQQTANPQNVVDTGIATGFAQMGLITEGGGTNSRPDIWAELGNARSTAYADLAAATAVTINDLRTAFQIQRLLERDARGGTRYIEKIFSHFGVRSDDARLQRPEFLGGGTTRINVNPIAATVATSTEPQANLAAYGTGVARGGFNKSFTEHGYIIGIISARADLTYQAGINRMWTRETQKEFFWPTLAHLGEQAVLNYEIFVSGDAEIDQAVFGYQERYAEYRYKPSMITGLFNSNADDSLDVWHLSQDFDATPALNSSFITENPPIDRVIAVPSEPHFLCDMWLSLQCTRPMPLFSVPGLIDHF